MGHLDVWSKFCKCWFNFVKYDGDGIGMKENLYAQILELM